MTQFAGICVGGPLDGQWLALEAPVYRFVERKPISCLNPFKDPPPEMLTVNIQWYTWTGDHWKFEQ